MKQLTDEDIATVCQILDGWTGKLTWEDLIEAIAQRLLRRYTRQALFRHIRIRQAFDQRKEKLRNGYEQPVARTAELQLALDRVERLKSENERLTEENRRLLEQFVRWSYNAHSRGITEQQLNQPLPTVDRGKTI